MRGVGRPGYLLGELRVDDAGNGGPPVESGGAPAVRKAEGEVRQVLADLSADKRGRQNRLALSGTAPAKEVSSSEQSNKIRTGPNDRTGERAWGMRRSNRMRWVQMISGLSVSATNAAAKAAGPRALRRAMRDSGRRGPRADRADRGADGSRATPAKSCLRGHGGHGAGRHRGARARRHDLSHVI